MGIISQLSSIIAITRQNEWPEPLPLYQFDGCCTKTSPCERPYGRTSESCLVAYLKAGHPQTDWQMTLHRTGTRALFYVTSILRAPIKRANTARLVTTGRPANIGREARLKGKAAGLGAALWVWALSSMMVSPVLAADACVLPERYTLPLLRSAETLDLCEVAQDKVLLVVNTASECGFTPQFEQLESLYNKYRDQGLVITGFPSDDFHQELVSDDAIADVCYLNYGVTFPMLAPDAVTGDKASPVFQWLSSVTGKPPVWNFNKYLVSRDGQRVKHYHSAVTPLNSALEQAILAELSR